MILARHGDGRPVSPGFVIDVFAPWAGRAVGPSPGTVPDMLASLDDHVPENFALTLVRYHDPVHHDACDEVLRLAVLRDQLHLHRSVRSRVGRPAPAQLRSRKHRSSRAAHASLRRSLLTAERAGFVPITGLVPIGPAPGRCTLDGLPELLAGSLQEAWTALEMFRDARVASLVRYPRALVLLPGLDDGFPAPRLLVSGFGLVLSEGSGSFGEPAVIRVPPGLESVISALCPFATWAPPDGAARFALSLMESYPVRALTRSRFAGAVNAAEKLAA